MSHWRLGLAAIPFILIDPRGGFAAECSVLPLPIHRGDFSTVSAPVVGSDSDSIPLVQLATIEYSYEYGMGFGDTDHDGRIEVALTGPPQHNFRIWEHQGDNVYSLVASGPSHLITYALADTDQDGRGELIGQTSGYVEVWESADASSHPSLLVWSSPYLSNFVGHTMVADSDQDGKAEIIHSVNAMGSASDLVIFENTGDNQLALKFSTTLLGPGATGDKVVADLDGDGRMEIALCGSPGWLFVFESLSDDVWVRTSRIWTGLENAYTMKGGVDTDGNGKREIFIMGTLFADSTEYLCTAIYENAGDDTLNRVGTLVHDEGSGTRPAILCNIDTMGGIEYVVSTTWIGLRVYRSTMPGTWEQVGIVYGFGGANFTYDLNQNGIPEVLWRDNNTTRIKEYPVAVTDSGVAGATNLRIVPNPCRDRSVVMLPPGMKDVATLAVYDVRGRLVEERSADGRTGPIAWQPKELPAGVYLLRLEDPRGRVLASGRGTKVR